MSRYTAVSSTMGVSTPDLDAKPYRYRGQKDWNPARVKLPATSRSASEAVRAAARETGRRRTEAKAAKLAEFARLITEDGLTVQEAGQRLGYGPKTAETYWREIKRQRREQAQP